ncbi:hypothetical protein SBOR_6500 [Sclerotinia borealis F-4128]|uniref:DUF7730 domain-containing protein n=1 Tax=Sclerotinia borealis (strain F-4128) TaxID=1432307 RepID=W9CBC4_SCLBF|nr:hypothetical protein SBOR_6500 [Sclerotinia borealis F-4128]
MARTFLDTLPREIRDQIYGYVLSSHSRSVYLSESVVNDPDHPQEEYSAAGTPPYIIRTKSHGETIRLSFLRTCRQIYQEAKVIFWEQNSLILDGILPRTYIDHPILGSLPGSIASMATSVELKIDILGRSAFRRKSDLCEDSPSLVPFEYQLKDLAQWPNLKTIKLHMSLGEDPWGNYDGYGHSGFARLLYWRLRGGSNDHWHNLVRSNIKALEEAGGKDGYLSHVKKELDINTGCALPNGNGFPQRMLKTSTGSPREVLQELSEAWFGTLSIDNRLSYLEGEEKENMFVQQPAPRLPMLDHFFFFKYDIDRWVDGQSGVRLWGKAKQIWPAGEEGKQARRDAWVDSGRMGCSFDVMREIHWPWKQMSAQDFVP